MNEWRSEALCRDRTELFFADKPDPARFMCARCPVAWPCVSFAIDNLLFDPGDGIWGGMDPGQRLQLVEQEPMIGSRTRARLAHAKYLARVRGER